MIRLTFNFINQINAGTFPTSLYLHKNQNLDTAYDRLAPTFVLILNRPLFGYRFTHLLTGPFKYFKIHIPSGKSPLER